MTKDSKKSQNKVSHLKTKFQLTKVQSYLPKIISQQENISEIAYSLKLLIQNLLRKKMYSMTVAHPMIKIKIYTHNTKTINKT